MTETVKSTIDGDVATLVIDREARRNALDHHTVIGLRTVFAELEESAVKVIVLTGAGEKSFCAGDDIKAYKDRTVEDSKAHFIRGLHLMDEIANHPCLVIAAIEGYCVGGGLELAIACDHRMASDTSLFALPEVRKLQANPSWGGLTRLPKLIGLNFARQLALMGRDWDANTALNHGLIDQIVAAGTVLKSAQEFAAEYAADVNRDTVMRAKRILNDAVTSTDQTAFTMNLLCEQAQPFEGI